jgi:ABC-2 type transport system permease protein
MRAALLIARKDIRQRLRDRSALLVAIVVPLVLASTFGLIFHDVSTGNACSCEFALVDEDHGDAAAAFRTQALAPLERRHVITVHAATSEAAVRDDVDAGKVGAAFVLPAGLSAAVHSGRPAQVRVIGDVDASITTQVGEAIATSYASRIETLRVAAATLGSRTPPDLGPDPLVLANVSTASRQLDIGTFYAAGMAVFFLFFTVQFGVSSILDERREGTLARMLVAPIRRGSVLVGKLLTSVVLGVVSMVVLALATHFLLDAHWGNPLGVLALIVAGVIAATSVMAVIATYARTADQAQSWQSMAALVLGMLGGTFFPVAQAGGVIASLSLATPQAWFLRGVQDLGGGEGVSAVAGPVLAMLAFAAVMTLVALPRVGRLTAR